MKSYRNVVVATDFSAGGQGAIGAVEAIAGKGPLTVHVVHVLEPVVYVVPGSTVGTIMRARRADARVRLRSLAEALAKRVGAEVTVHTELTSGPPDVQICNLADRVRADLVIVGSHGRTGFRRAVLGSVAERVARFAKRPVLIVPLAGTHRRR
jgi:nucleotide-binding universal stress UspA family protein